MEANATEEIHPQGDHGGEPNDAKDDADEIIANHLPQDRESSEPTYRSIGEIIYRDPHGARGFADPGTKAATNLDIGLCLLDRDLRLPLWGFRAHVLCPLLDIGNLLRREPISVDRFVGPNIRAEHE